MKIFITGNNGLIGNALEKRLIEEKHDIVGSIDSRSGLDLSCLKSWGIRSNIDLFVHAAAAVKINQIIDNPGIANETNANGTFYALEFCRKNKIPKFVFMSSSRVLNQEKNAYTASKVYGEELCKAYANCYGLDYLIIRPSTVYGPFWDGSKRLIHLFITSALAGKELKIFGDPKTKTLDFTYVDDFVEGVMLAINQKEWNKEYDISGKEESNIYDLAKSIIRLAESNSVIKTYPEEVAQPQQVSVNISEIEKIGYIPRVKLKEGMRRTVEFYKGYLRKNPIN